MGKTAEEILEHEFESIEITTNETGRKIIEAMKKYAEEVAIQVRQECCNKAKADSYWDEMERTTDVDKQSILSVDIKQFIK